jgi:BioD-like phosphotransacetylase family protein
MEQSCIFRKTLRPSTVRLKTLQSTGIQQNETAKVIVNDLFVSFHSIHYQMEYLANLISNRQHGAKGSAQPGCFETPSEKSFRLISLKTPHIKLKQLCFL